MKELPLLPQGEVPKGDSELKTEPEVKRLAKSGVERFRDTLGAKVIPKAAFFYLHFPVHEEAGESNPPPLKRN